MEWKSQFGYTHDDRSIYDIVKDRQKDEHNRKFLIHGNVQSGKTHVAQCCTLYHVVERNCIGVHIVRNLNMDRIQYMNRLKRFIYINSCKIKDKVEIVDIQNTSVEDLDVSESGSTTNTNSNSNSSLDLTSKVIVVVMANNHQFKKLNTLLGIPRFRDQRIHITIDESDSITVRTSLKKKQAEFFKSVVACYDTRIVETVYITATIDLHVFRYDESQSLKVKDIISLKKNDNYIGFEEISQWNTFDFNDKKRMTYENYDFLHYIIKKDMLPTPCRIVNNTQVPKLMNVHISFVIKDHDDIMDEICSNLSEDEIKRVTFLKHDASRLEIHYKQDPSRGSDVEDLLPSVNHPKKYTKQTFDNGFVKHTYTKGLTTIRDLLCMLKFDKHKNHENIIFINGKSDGRGVSVNSEERAGVVFIGWNVVILPNKTNLSNITQITGRQCGRYHETDVVRRSTKIYVTEKTKQDILGYCAFINFFLDLLVNAKNVRTPIDDHSNPMDPNVSVLEFIEKTMNRRGIKSFPMNSELWNSQTFGKIPFEVLRNGRVVYNPSYKKCVYAINEDHYVDVLESVLSRRSSDTSCNLRCYELCLELTRKPCLSYKESGMFFKDESALKRFLSSKVATVFVFNSKSRRVMIHPQILPFLVETFMLKIEYVNAYEKLLYECFTLT